MKNNVRCYVIKKKYKDTIREKHAEKGEIE